jgi:hypothetical protein
MLVAPKISIPVPIKSSLKEPCAKYALAEMYATTKQTTDRKTVLRMGRRRGGSYTLALPDPVTMKYTATAANTTRVINPSFLSKHVNS